MIIGAVVVLTLGIVLISAYSSVQIGGGFIFLAVYMCLQAFFPARKRIIGIVMFALLIVFLVIVILIEQSASAVLEGFSLILLLFFGFFFFLFISTVSTRVSQL